MSFFFYTRFKSYFFVAGITKFVDSKKVSFDSSLLIYNTNLHLNEEKD